MDFKPFKIGKYLLLERIATGGMAEVYRAKASGAGGFEKQLAIKRILPTYSQNEEFRRMFEYEARLSSMLNHANIVQVYDFVKSGETYLLAMEYVPGKNLRQFVNKAKKLGVNPPISFSAWVINEVCKGLEYAHKKKDDLTGKPLNIIHRDMSPQNVMMSYDGAVKIVDFGIAKAKDRVDETRSGVIKGKFGYMSPEQANGQPIDHRSDIFSTAIILFEMIAGRRLFTADNDMATLKMIQECVIPAPSRLNPKIPAEFEKIVLKALTKDLNLRYQSAGVLSRHLQAFLNKYFPSFTQKEASDIIQRVFHADIEKENKRFEQLYRQSIPFSQGAKLESEDEPNQDIELGIDGEDITRSEQIEKSAITNADDREDAISYNVASEPGAATHVGNTGAGNIDATQIDSLIIEDNSVSTLNGGEETGSQGSFSTNEKTQVEDPLLDLPNPNSTSFTPGTGTNKTRGNTGTGRTNEKSVTGLTRGNSFVQPGSGRSSRPTNISNADSDLVLNNSYVPDQNTEDEIVPGNQLPQDSISLETNVREIDRPIRSKGSSSRPPAFNPTTDYVPRKRKSRILPLTMLLALVSSTGYLYSVYLDGKLPVLIQMISDRNITTTPTEEANVPANNKSVETIAPISAEGNCVLEVTTDPPGATLLINQEKRGVTGTTTYVRCGEPVDISLRLDGYEIISENRVFEDRGESASKIYRTLKRIPTGELELILNRNADIYINGQLARQANANTPVVIRLRGNREYTVRFVNEVLGIDVTRKFPIQTDSVTRQNINLEIQ